MNSWYNCITIHEDGYTVLILSSIYQDFMIIILMCGIMIKVAIYINRYN